MALVSGFFGGLDGFRVQNHDCTSRKPDSWGMVLLVLEMICYKSCNYTPKKEYTRISIV